MKIYLKYSLLLAFVIVLSAGSITGVALLLQRHALTYQALLRAESIAVNLSLVSAEAILTRNVLQLVPLTTDATTRHENVVYAAVIDQTGLVLAHPDRAQLRKPFLFEHLANETSYAVQAAIQTGVGLGRLVWDVSVPVKAKGSLIELGRVHVGIDQRGVEASVSRSLKQLFLVATLCLVLGLALAVYFIRILVRPLQVLSLASAQVGRGDFEVQVPVQSQDEVGELAANFNQMVGNLKAAELRQKVAQRMESELQLAHSIQKGLLPSKDPDLPGWESAFACTPALELGGDYYDWYPVAGGRKVGFAVADVSGKGVPAALHTANLRNLLRFTTAEMESPLQVMCRVNSLAFPDLEDKAFITMVYAVLDPQTGEFTYVNAGHDPLLWVRANGSIEVLPSTTYPVGIVDGAEFEEGTKDNTITLEKGDLVFLYTDGVTEAENEQGKQFGEQRIASLIQGVSAKQAVEQVRSKLNEYIGGRVPHDDVTLLALRRTP